jgi:hypothetical protein
MSIFSDQARRQATGGVASTCRGTLATRLRLPAIGPTERKQMMNKVIALSLVAVFSTASIAAADDVTVIKRHTDVDPDTTGSVVVKERQPDVVKKKVIVKEKHDDPSLTIKGKVNVE